MTMPYSGTMPILRAPMAAMPSAGHFFQRALAGRKAKLPGYGQRLDTMAQEQATFSQGKEQAAYEAANAYNPEDAYAKYMEAARSGAADTLGTQLKALAGHATAAGRLNTGFYDLDQGDVARNVWADYGRTAASGALQVAGLQNQKNQQMLGYGQDTTNRYLDLLAAGYDRKTAEQNAKRARSGGFLKTLGKVGGALLGSVAGPVGTALGSKIGGAIFK
jgi:hypothetical protein